MYTHIYILHANIHVVFEWSCGTQGLAHANQKLCHQSTISALKIFEITILLSYDKS